MLGLGTAGGYLAHHSGHKFSTKDQDNDISPVNCATQPPVQGAWWYYDCRESNLNGVYPNGGNNGTLLWGYIYPVKRAEMKIRPMNF